VKLLVKLGLLLLELLLQVEIVLLQLEVLLELDGVDSRRPGTHRAGGLVLGEALIGREELLAVTAGGPVDSALVALEKRAEGGNVDVAIVYRSKASLSGSCHGLSLALGVHRGIVDEREPGEVAAIGRVVATVGGVVLHYVHKFLVNRSY